MTSSKGKTKEVQVTAGSAIYQGLEGRVINEEEYSKLKTPGEIFKCVSPGWEETSPECVGDLPKVAWGESHGMRAAADYFKKIVTTYNTEYGSRHLASHFKEARQEILLADQEMLNDYVQGCLSQKCDFNLATKAFVGVPAFPWDSKQPLETCIFPFASKFKKGPYPEKFQAFALLRDTAQVFALFEMRFNSKAKTFSICIHHPDMDWSKNQNDQSILWQAHCIKLQMTDFLETMYGLSKTVTNVKESTVRVQPPVGSHPSLRQVLGGAINSLFHFQWPQSIPSWGARTRSVEIMALPLRINLSTLYTDVPTNIAKAKGTCAIGQPFERTLPSAHGHVDSLKEKQNAFGILDNLNKLGDGGTAAPSAPQQKPCFVPSTLVSGMVSLKQRQACLAQHLLALMETGQDWPKQKSEASPIK